MTWPEAEAIAKAGTPVRRSIWAATRTLYYARGAGTTRSVAVQAIGGTVSVVRSSDFGRAEFEAADWVAAA